MAAHLHFLDQVTSKSWITCSKVLVIEDLVHVAIQDSEVTLSRGLLEGAGARAITLSRISNPDFA